MRQSSFNSNTPRLQALTGLRWVAALMVFLYHAAAERLIDDALGGSIFVWATSKAGFVGVSFFFILSGFVLAWTNRKSTRTTTFWLRRIVKIFPNHLVTYAAALTLILCTRPLLPRGSVWSGALPNLLLLQTWVPNPYTFISVNGVSWSLSCELFFYAMFPALLFWIQRIDSRRLWWWALGIAALIGFVPVFAEWLPAGPKLPWKDTPSYPYWFVYVFPPTRALEFALGMIMARIVKERRGPSVRPWLACLLVVCAYVCALGAPYLYGFAAITALPLAILIGSVAHAEQADRVRWLRGRVMVHLGEVSFAFYLVHRLALMYGHMGVGEHVPWGALGGTVFIAATFGVSWLVAFALHRWVEQPVVDWARRVERPRDQAHVAGNTLLES